MRQIAIEEIEGLPQLQHETGIDGVLARGAPVDKGSGLRVRLGDKPGQGFDHRNGHITRERGCTRQRLHVK
jgi:hypothetical protein